MTLAAHGTDTLPDPGFLLPASCSSARQPGAGVAERVQEAVRLTRAEVGLLHVCGEAFLFTVAVHGLDPACTCTSGVVLDDAMQHVLRAGR